LPELVESDKISVSLLGLFLIPELYELRELDEAFSTK
jgi:hypothetical protein